jgi:2',3'-cyclic-nucleotide 2'-phosphodiesterase (5'-nucleotidase family)
MLKTINFQVNSKAGVFWLALWFLTGCVPGVAQQSNPASHVQVGPPSAGTGKSGSAQSAGTSEPRSKTTETLIDADIPDDPAVDKMLEPYGAKVRALEIVIGKVEDELKNDGLGAGSLGNLVTDGMRARASVKLGLPVDLAISNSGGLRKNGIPPGDLRVRDIFELMPFEDSLVELELTGEQLLKVLQVVIASREPQSGARIKYRAGADNKPEFVSATLISAAGEERSIDPTAVYRVITIDYLLSVKGGHFAILQEAKSRKPLGITIRDALIDYVKAQTAAGRPIRAKLDGRFAGPPDQRKDDPR